MCSRSSLAQLRTLNEGTWLVEMIRSTYMKDQGAESSFILSVRNIM